MKASLVVALLFLVGVFAPPVFGQASGLDYSIRGGEVTDIDIDEENSSLIILIDPRTKGELVITLPRSLIDAKTDFEDTNFEILINGLGLSFFDETKTEKDRTVSIPFSRSDSEIVIVGTHLFGQDKSQHGIENQIDKTINDQLDADIPSSQARLLIFSDTQWSGALQSTSFPFTEKDGSDDDIVIFSCDSPITSEGVFGAKFQKLTEEGYLKLVVIQNKEVVSQGSSEEPFGEVLISDNCVSTAQSGDGAGSGGGCLIATATYGSEMAPEVQKLREVRDNSLLQTESGRTFMNSFNDFYYLFSPVVADYERENPAFRELVKIAITPMITSLSILNHVDMDSDAEVLGYGISLIIINAVTYFGLPAGLIVIIQRRRKIQL